MPFQIPKLILWHLTHIHMYMVYLFLFFFFFAWLYPQNIKHWQGSIVKGCRLAYPITGICVTVLAAKLKLSSYKSVKPVSSCNVRRDRGYNVWEEFAGQRSRQVMQRNRLRLPDGNLTRCMLIIAALASVFSILHKIKRSWNRARNRNPSTERLRNPIQENWPR